MSHIFFLDNGLLSLIVGQVAHHADHLSLRQTCRLFEALVSQYLFQQVAVSPIGNDLAKFLRVAYSPRLSQHVQELIWLELDCPIAEGSRIQWFFPPFSVPPWYQMVLCEKNGLFWHSYSPLDIPSGISNGRPYMVRDGLLAVFLEAIARMPKLRTFTSVSMDFDTFHRRCGREITLTRSRDLRSQRWPCACRSQLIPGENAPANDVFLKGAELYVLPALVQKNAVSNRWLQLHWLSSSYFVYSPPQIPLQLAHVPPIPEAVVEFTFNIGRIDSPVGEPERRQRHLEMQHKLYACLANAQNLRTLRLTAFQRFPAAWPCAKKARDHYFFDLLVGQAAGPNRGELYLPKLDCLSLESVSFSQAGLKKFIKRHVHTLRILELSDCRLEFDTVKGLATLGLRLEKFEMTSVRLMMEDIRRMRNEQYQFFGGRWMAWRVFEFITPESLLRLINKNTTPEAEWATLEPTRFGRIPYQAHFNFLVTTEDVREFYRADWFNMPAGDIFEQHWESLVQEGKGIDFRQPSHPEMVTCLGDEHGEGTYYPDDGAVIYPTGESPGDTPADLTLLEKLKRRALELSLSTEHVEEVQSLMETHRREEGGSGNEGSD
ncbi:hypothetical protein N0V85_006161 [Neurospora sp. IMI 360204]|nr:hypothetical protein N0V85_006161 [Neurospora sp. IMI 360204]